jgi:hypothetical protein
MKREIGCVVALLRSTTERSVIETQDGGLQQSKRGIIYRAAAIATIATLTVLWRPSISINNRARSSAVAA